MLAVALQVVVGLVPGDGLVHAIRFDQHLKWLYWDVKIANCLLQRDHEWMARSAVIATLQVLFPGVKGVHPVAFILIAKVIDADLAIIDKRRSEDGHAEVLHVVGNVRGKLCIIQDDIVDTAGTLQQAAQALRENGASQVVACAVHGVLSGPALQRIENSELERVIVTNTIPLRPECAASNKIQVLSVAPLLARAIQSIHQETSVSSLFV